MAILAFQKPDKVIMLEGTNTVGRFEFRPLEPGYGQTIGNALRRILLASLEGFAISQIRVSGVDNEFATIPGVIEGMQEIILNLKQVRFKRMVESVDSEEVNITISGKQEFTAEDISKGLSSFKVLNPEQHIYSLEPSVKLEINILITKGRGFVPATPILLSAPSPWTPSTLLSARSTGQWRTGAWNRRPTMKSSRSK